MGVASPHVSDETCYIMVESSANSCRCNCQEDVSTDSSSSSSSCSGPQIFTSVLLGVLACVLMTGGVFLAFHRWDPLWLIVSGVGVILVLIGSVLHCCNARREKDGRRHSSGNSKTCCPTDRLHNHVAVNNGSLTEQLLPLSNARSVSQLSLNMLPGYFPPVVTAYGIEQHSAVVQNINRIIQQQQQQQQQQQAQQQAPSSPQSTTAPGNIPGKNFILLSLPGDTPQANLQNLVATVYQLDGSVVTDTSSPIDVNSSSVATTAIPVQTVAPKLKNAEVQTCSGWPVPNLTTVENASTTAASTSISVVQSERSSATTASGTTQTDHIEQPVAINLMDCSPDNTPICDILPNHNDPSSNHSDNSVPSVLVDVTHDSATASEDPSTSVTGTPNTSILEPSNALMGIEEASVRTPNIPISLSDVLIDISENSTEPLSNSTPQVTEVFPIPTSNLASNNVSSTTPSTNSAASISNHCVPSTVASTSSVASAANCSVGTEIVSTRPVVKPASTGADSIVAPTSRSSDVLVGSVNHVIVPLSGAINSNSRAENIITSISGASNCTNNSVDSVLTNLLNGVNIVFDPTMPSTSSGLQNSTTYELNVELTLEIDNTENVSNCSNLSAVDAEVDDGESIGRSSPPPSYEDVALENDNAMGAFGIGYGTL